MLASSDPAGYMDRIATNPLPGTPVHQLLIQYNLGDAQVTWLGALTLGRSTGAVMFPNNPRENDEQLYGFEVVSGPVTSGAVIQGWTFDAPVVPQTNIPASCVAPRAAERFGSLMHCSSEYDTHECVRRDPRAQDQMSTWEPRWMKARGWDV